jgi:hypothetical protein
MPPRLDIACLGEAEKMGLAAQHVVIGRQGVGR